MVGSGITSAIEDKIRSCAEDQNRTGAQQRACAAGSGEQIRDADNLDHGDQKRRDELHDHAERVLLTGTFAAGERTIRTPAHCKTRRHRAERHENGVGNPVQNLQKVFAEETEQPAAVQGTAQRYGHRDRAGRADAGHKDGRAGTVNAVALDDELRYDLHNGHNRSQCGDGRHGEEEKGDKPSDHRHLTKNERKREKDKADPAHTQLGGGRAAHRDIVKQCRENRKTHHEGDHRVQDADHRRRTEEIDIFPCIGTVGDHGAAPERQREKGLAHGGENPGPADGMEVRAQIENQTFPDPFAEG